MRNYFADRRGRAIVLMQSKTKVICAF